MMNATIQKDKKAARKIILEKDYPPLAVIDDRAREENRRRFFTGGVRINSGRYRTDEEEKQHRKKVLETQLP